MSFYECFFLFIFLVNKRLDEWVSVDRLDTRKVQYPRRDGQPGTGVNTPKKTSEKSSCEI